jgi:hypothetical protein
MSFNLEDIDVLIGVKQLSVVEMMFFPTDFRSDFRFVPICVFEYLEQGVLLAP